MIYHLQKYEGTHTRHECPQCHSKHSFTLYVDDDGKELSFDVGKCNHLTKCGYHKTPKEYFAEHTDARTKLLLQKPFNLPSKPTQTKPKPFDTLPFAYVTRSQSENSTLIEFLKTLFDTDKVQKVCELYHVGATKDKATIFWQIDTENRVRTGKMIKYNTDGHRQKDCANALNWAHALLKKANKIPSDYNLQQCFFGMHLLADARNDGKKIAIVESEKTALIGSIVFDSFVWLATGSVQNLKNDFCECLSGREVVLFPDVDGTEVWKQKAKGITVRKNVQISDFLAQKYAGDPSRSTYDFADEIIAEIQSQKQQSEQTYSEAVLSLIRENDCFGRFIERFGLIEIKQPEKAVKFAT